KKLPVGVTISDLEFEGPELVIYTKEPRKLADNGEIVRSIAKDVRKRIVIRPDKSVLNTQDDAIVAIKKIVPEDAGITNYYFDPDLGEVMIEAEKPGLVIGQHGTMLREITKHIGWTPKVVRTPPIESSTIKNVRRLMRESLDERKQIMRELGKKIHRSITSPDRWIRITALGGCREVGRSCFLLSTPETRILVDCGINVGAEDNGSTPYLYIPEVSPINHLDGVVITHAHLDHCGLVPLLYKYDYQGPVYVTPPTRDLMSLLQIDYIDVANKEGRRIPYGSDMVREELKHTIVLDYGSVTDIAPDMKLTFHNAGHILGSAVAHFHIGDGLHNVVFTGDFKYEKTRLFDSAVNNFPRAETVVMEATYGGPDDFQPPRKTAETNITQIVKRTIERGGKALIPAFAVGRSQDVMLVLEEAIRKKMIDKVPIYLDGMIWEATAIHTTHPEYLNSDLRSLIFHKGMNPFLSDCFVRVDSQKMRENLLSDLDPAIIISTSGMMNGGPIMEYLKAFAPDEKSTLIFVGYQAEGTLGQRIQKGRREIPITRRGTSEILKINLEVCTVDGFSGHSDRNQLMNYIRNMRPKPELVMTEHGDERNCLNLASSIYNKYHIKTQVPRNLETVRVE
ncbi:MAG: beta-CASP ribonuclease aCPSF1, partial [Nitrospiraceae bacterium]|nr:beta-CASP ribonuclease aCPSF1 [Nitrospiraceae bacterium]